jgi:hypothetical protein
MRLPRASNAPLLIVLGLTIGQAVGQAQTLP